MYYIIEHNIILHIIYIYIYICADNLILAIYILRRSDINRLTTYIQGYM